MNATLPSGWRVRAQRAEDAQRIGGWINQAGQAVAGVPAPGAIALVLADAQDQALACLRLHLRLGLDRPRYSYHLGRIVHAAPELQLFSAQQTLLLGNDHTGQSELADLACASQLAPPAQQQALAALLQQALAQWAQQRPPGVDRLIVELAGLRDARGVAPFWDGLGRHFYAGDPDQAQARFGQDWCSHLAALLPRQLLYVSFLSEAAQAALGRVGRPGEAAAQALHAAGLRFSQHVRIDDGGPVMVLLA